MTKFISRQDFHGEEIEQLNKEIGLLKISTRDSEYLSSVIKSLNEIDYQYFNEIISNVRSLFEINKYYLDVDKNKEIINLEIPYIIEMYLQQLLDIVPDNKNLEATQINYDKLINIFYQEKIDEIKHIEDWQNLEVQKLVKSRQLFNKPVVKSHFDPKVLSGLLKRYENTSTKALMSEIADSMRKQILKIQESKKSYKIRIKWFLIILPVLITCLIISIVLPFIV